jgi:uncharacterized protein with von Willebrand factor type A (vWA) domain
MEALMTRFVHALRSAQVPVSPAETLDGFRVAEVVGLQDRVLLRNALALTLAKSRTEKDRFDACFDRFFGQLAFAEKPKPTLLASFDHEELLRAARANLSTRTQELAELVLAQNQTELALKVQELAERIHIQDMQALRDKSHFSELLGRELGVAEFAALQTQLSGALASGAGYLRQYVQTQIKTYVDVQYRLIVDASGRRALLDAAIKGNLDQVSPEYYREVEKVVQRIADRLTQQHKRRNNRAHRGVLDVRRMLRKNLAYDGSFFHLAWRKRKKEQAAVYVVCDVSNSVARIARFLLLLLHSLNDVLPNVRSFAFSNRLGEVTDTFSRNTSSQAIEQAMFDWGKGTTDYGKALVDFRELVHHKLDSRSTVIFLGDARSNYFDPRADILKEVQGRAKQVFWLNPEPRDGWGEGDSEMKRYAPFCLRVHRLASLQDLERFADTLLTAIK